MGGGEWGLLEGYCWTSIKKQVEKQVCPSSLRLASRYLEPVALRFVDIERVVGGADPVLCCWRSCIKWCMLDQSGQVCIIHKQMGKLSDLMER